MDDPEALLAHEPFLRALARSLVRDPGDADDAVQETWAAALAHPPREGRTVRAWLAAVVRNAIRQGRRAAVRRSARELLVARPEAVPSESEIREREGLRREIVDAVLSLGPIHRDVLVLLYLDGLPPREAAARLGVPVETVKSRRKRALARLREDLDRGRGGRKAWIAALLPLADGGAEADPPPSGAPLTALAGTAAVVLLVAGAAVAFLRSGKAVGVDPSSPDSPRREEGGSASRSEAAKHRSRNSGEVQAGMLGGAMDRGSTTGRVLDGAGRPVGRAFVFAAKDPRLADMDWEAKTGTDGAFTVGERHAGRWILAWSPGTGVSAWALPPAGGGAIDLPLGSGGVVAGRVVDRETGAPVPGVPVELRFGDARNGDPGKRRTESGADGAYEFAEVPVGTAVEPFAVTGFRAAAPAVEEREGRPEEILPGRIEDGEARILLREGERWDRDVPVIRRQGVEAAVRIRFPADLPAPGSVGMCEEWQAEGGSVGARWEQVVDSGTPCVHLFLPKGTVLISASIPGYRGATAPLEIEGNGGPLDVELALRPLPKVAARLVDAAGEPLLLEGIRVQAALRPPWTKVGSNTGIRAIRFLGFARTDGTGRADLTDLLPAAEDGTVATQEFLVMVQGEGVLGTGADHPSLRMPGEELLRRIRAAGPAGFEIPVPAPSTRDLRIRVVDGDGRPAAGVAVVVPEGVPGRRGFEAKLGPWRSGADGMVLVALSDLTDVDAPDRLAAAEPWHGEMPLSAALEALQGDVIPELRVHRLVPFRVTVRDGTGSAIPGARGVFDGREFRADGAGVLVAEIPDSARPVSIRVDHPGFLPGEPVRMPGEGTGEVALEAGRAIPVEVSVPDGGNGDGMCVAVYDAAGGLRLSSTGGLARKGVLRMDLEVPATGARLVAWSGDGALRGEVTASGREPLIRIPLESAAQTAIPLVFEDSEGSPLPGMAFTATYATGGPNVQRMGVADAEGRAEIRVPFEGGGRLWVHLEGRTAWGASPILDRPPPSRLRLVVDSTREIEVALEGPRAEESAWFVLGDGRGPLQVWPGDSRKEEGHLRLRFRVPSSATTLRIVHGRRETSVPIPAGESPIAVRVE